MTTLKDPMLQAAAEALRSHPDHLRWLSFADDELARLRNQLGLPTPTGYAAGLPCYPSGTSDHARRLRAEVERRMEGRFSPTDRIAVEQVLDEILARHRASKDQRNA